MSKVERVFPLLVYKDIQKAHDFLVNAFGFQSGGVERDREGHAIHAEVCVGPVTIWLHRVVPEHQLDAPVSASSGLVVQVSDVDEHFQKARAAGAHIDGEPVDMPYAQREYGARDIEGHRWWFFMPKERPQ
jgi:uncharacterized glyoxalase superfamily protein PhnB